jgi:hypothetical protein
LHPVYPLIPFPETPLESHHSNFYEREREGEGGRGEGRGRERESEPVLGLSPFPSFIYPNL